MLNEDEEFSHIKHWIKKMVNGSSFHALKMLSWSSTVLHSLLHKFLYIYICCYHILILSFMEKLFKCKNSFKHEMKKTCGVYACDRLKPSFEYINNQANSSIAPTIGQPQLLPPISLLSFLPVPVECLLAVFFF